MSRPEIQNNVKTGAFNTNYLEQGEGFPIMFIHGSGPGVSAYANWRLVLPKIAEVAHCYAPDMVGFGYTERPEDVKYGMETWTQQTIDFMDAVGIKTDLVGNSFGGALACLATKYPERIRRVVLGSMGVEFQLLKA